MFQVYRSAGAAAPPTAQPGTSGGSGLLGSWWFGASSSSQDGNNFLRVASAFPNRRLSDNTLMTPKIRIAPSCASSPGGSPGSTAGLPVRRHSSIGPQERRGSHVNLSPPTVSCKLYLLYLIFPIVSFLLVALAEWHFNPWTQP